MRKLLFWCCTAVVLVGCVTINIYFPAAAAQTAADKVIDEVWQLKDLTKDKEPQNTDTIKNPEQITNPDSSKKE